MTSEVQHKPEGQKPSSVVTEPGTNTANYLYRIITEAHAGKTVYIKNTRTELETQKIQEVQLVPVGINMKDIVDHLGRTQVDLFESIKFADQKATAFVTINLALLGAMYGVGLLAFKATGEPWVNVLSGVTFFSLAIGIILASFVIWPRGEAMARDTEGGELAIPSKIADAYDTPSDFRTALLKIDQEADKNKVLNNLSSLVHWRAKVNNIKYRHLSRSMVVSFIGWLGTIALVLFRS